MKILAQQQDTTGEVSVWLRHLDGKLGFSFACSGKHGHGSNADRPLQTAQRRRNCVDVGDQIRA
ncbi:hypothetical protein D3C80_763780 [compost metagenome]